MGKRRKKTGDRNLDPGGGRRRTTQIHKSKKKYDRRREKKIKDVDDLYDVSNHGYKPLPEGLTIKKSRIDGLGLFTEVPIPPEVVIGLSHVERYGFDNNLLRTPLGGFINHAKNSNLSLHRDEINEEYFYIVSTRRIEPGEELTLDYQNSICGALKKDY